MSIYLDNQATTPCDPRVVAAMLPLFEAAYGNPHSAEHAMGQWAARAVAEAREKIAALIGVEPREIIFTSGATEANNLAIKGAARFAGTRGPRRIITLATEHKCVLESVRDLAQEGFEPVILPIEPNGQLNPERLQEALRTPTLLVSIMAANNETGVLQALAPLAAMARQAGALFHSDIAQAAGKIPLQLNEIGVDLASISAHKLYGPKGIGALYIRHRPRVRLTPLFSGGGQERGLRSGTLPAPLIVGFGTACQIAETEMPSDAARILSLRHRLHHRLGETIPGLIQNNAGAPILPGTLNLRFPGVSALELLAEIPEICLSTGSACTAADISPSHVLSAMGLSASQARQSLRVGIGRFTSAADIETAASRLASAYQTLRAKMPHPQEA